MNYPNQFVSATTEYSTYDKLVPSPYFRKSFVLNEMPDKAELVICGVGFYALFVNGQEITNGILAPYISNPDHVLYYTTYNLLPHLRAGENVIGVQLGCGTINVLCPIWDMDKAPFRSAPKLACCFKQNDEVLFEAKDFKCHASPLYFDGLREGNFYDARNNLPGWCEAGYDDSDWSTPIRSELPRGEMRESIAEPILKHREIAPVKIWEGTISENHNVHYKMYEQFSKEAMASYEVPQNGYIYDFGENLTGISRLKIQGKPGQKIHLVYGDRLRGEQFDRRFFGFYPDGMMQSDIFICSGEEDVFEQRFSYYGYRYCFVTGIEKEQATPELLTAICANSALEKIGSFSCSDADTNTLYEIVQRSDITNFVYFLNDCPHREKNGWTGDSAMSAEHVILSYDATNSWREWLFNIRKAQRDDGRFPGIVPTDTWGIEWGNGPAWDSVLFNLPYALYVYRKNTEVITENAHAMLRYLEYVSRRRNEEGIIAIGIGDWAPVGGNQSNKIGDTVYEAPLELTDTLMVMDMCKKAEIMFEAIHLPANAAYAKALYAEFRTAARAALIDFNTMTARGESQSSQAMAIYYDLFDENEKEEAFAVLLRIIDRDHQSMQGGFLGLRVLFHVLAAFGEEELAYNMIVKRTYPSYGYILNMDFTTLPEQFFEDFTNRNISFNHHFHGDISHWFVRWIAGIHVSESGICIRPSFLSKLTFAEASYKTHDGTWLTVRWDKTSETEYTLKVDGAYQSIKAPKGYEMEKTNEEGVYRFFKN